MKRFLLTALISVISAYAILAAADFRLSGRLKESHGLVAVWSEILDGGLDADIVIMGASDAAYGISPAILDSILPGTKTYNLGCEGRFVLSQVAKYNTYLKRNRPPSVAVYSLTHMTLLSEQYYESRHLARRRGCVVAVVKYRKYVEKDDSGRGPGKYVRRPLAEPAARPVREGAEERQQEQRKHVVRGHNSTRKSLIEMECLGKYKRHYIVIHLPESADGQKCQTYKYSSFVIKLHGLSLSYYFV